MAADGALLLAGSLASTSLTCAIVEADNRDSSSRTLAFGGKRDSSSFTFKLEAEPGRTSISLTSPLGEVVTTVALPPATGLPPPPLSAPLLLADGVITDAGRQGTSSAASRR